MATTMEVGDSFNILGATVFWLYIAAALYFTYQTITTIVNIKPAQDEKDDRRKEDVVIFSSLATISFGTLSKNMLDVLIHSYRIWSERHGLTASLSPAQVWRWSITSTLFQDFGEALVATQERYLWVQSALFVTMSVCIFMALAGHQRKVPKLWTFFCLSQILPISFTLNLFYVALSRLPNRPQQTKISYAILGAIGAYCLCILFGSFTYGGLGLLGIILAARALLVSPLFLAEPGDATSEPKIPQFVGGEEAQSMIGVSIYVFTAYQGWRALAYRAEHTESFGLLDHPAVSSLGFDFILSVVSYMVWRWRTRAKRTATPRAK